MAIRISVREEEGILEVSYDSGPVGREDLAEQRKQVADAMGRSGLARILVDASSLEGLPGPFTLLRHNEGVAGHERLRKAAFAVVCSSLGEDERCLENTGVNRGIRLRCFLSRDEALAWLGTQA